LVELVFGFDIVLCHYVDVFLVYVYDLFLSVTTRPLIVPTESRLRNLPRISPINIHNELPSQVRLRQKRLHTHIKHRRPIVLRLIKASPRSVIIRPRVNGPTVVLVVLGMIRLVVVLVVLTRRFFTVIARGYSFVAEWLTLSYLGCAWSCFFLGLVESHLCGLGPAAFLELCGNSFG